MFLNKRPTMVWGGGGGEGGGGARQTRSKLIPSCESTSQRHFILTVNLNRDRANRLDVKLDQAINVRADLRFLASFDPTFAASPLSVRKTGHVAHLIFTC